MTRDREIMGSLARDLLDRAMRATLHRLNGIHALLSGWLLIGIPPGQETAVEARLDEDRLLLARLSWLRGVLHAGVRPEVLLAGEAPRVLLAAALGLGTPEEAASRLPRFADPQAGLALALWAQAVRGNDGEAVPSVGIGEQGLVARHPKASRRAGDLEEILEPYRRLLVTKPDGSTIHFKPGVFSDLPAGGAAPFVPSRGRAAAED